MDTGVTTPYSLGVNTCFAVKRWPNPSDWASIVREEFGLSLVQHTLDLVDLDAQPDLVAKQSEEIRSACLRNGLSLHSTFTGLAAYSSNLLLHPREAMRRRAEEWFERAITFTAGIGGLGTGGHVGAYSVADWRHHETRKELEGELQRALARLARCGKRTGLTALYIEAMAVAREPSTMDQIERLLLPGDPDHVPITLCLDVGHQCVFGSEGNERSPYSWLRRMGPHVGVIHLQQSDEGSDHHWPFTPERNAIGRIVPKAVFAALGSSNFPHPPLILEIIHPFEASDDQVISDIRTSVEYWKKAI